MLSAIEPSSVANRLLSALPPDALGRLLPMFRRVEMPFRAVILTPNEPITAVHFPESGYVSMLAVLEDGNASEVGMCGREGFVGVPLLLGTDRSPLEGLVQSCGGALRMEADAFHHAVGQEAALRTALLRYASAQHFQVTMTAACNARHLIEQRLARWLLMAHDRADADGFTMTHEFLSMMLGVRRAGVTVAAGALQKAGLIRYEQGRVHVRDRPGLEAAACECHGLVGREYVRLLGAGALARPRKG